MIARHHFSRSSVGALMLGLTGLLLRPAAAQVALDAGDNQVLLPPAAVHERRVVRSGAARVLSIPELAPPTIVAATVRPSANPFKAPATALFAADQRLFMGLADGGIAFCDAETGGHGVAVRFPERGLPVRAVAARAGTVWWLSGDAAQVFAYRELDRTVTSYAVDASENVGPATPGNDRESSEASAPATTARTLGLTGGIGWVKRLTPWGSRLLLTGDGVARLLDPVTGALSRPGYEEFPAGLIQPDGSQTLYAAQAGNGVSMIAAVPCSGHSAAGTPRLYQSGWAQASRGWQSLYTGPADSSGTLAAYRSEAMTREPQGVAMSPFGCALAGPAGIHVVQQRSGEGILASDIGFGRMPGIPTVLDSCSLGGSGTWWLMRGTLFHADSSGVRSEAYLPWNSARGAHIEAILPDRDGAYVALDRGGVRRIIPGRPTADDGYAGFVRVPLGENTSQPASGLESQVAAEVEAWQGVPYLWGGQTKQGTDCSGFVGAVHRVAGVQIPRSTAEMASSRLGRRVLDEVHYGDVLVFPGHCALYIGNGVTAETVATQVSKASVWRRSQVVIRRYLP
jgi:hypothetical protein